MREPIRRVAKIRSRAVGIPALQQNASGIAKIRRIGAVMNELPLAATAALAFTVGVFLLYRYFAFIDYTPADLSGILSLATLAAAWLFIFWILMTIAMFGTTAAIKAYEVKGLDRMSIFFGQVAAVSLLHAFIFYHAWPVGWHGAMGIGVVATVFTVGRLKVKSPGRTVGALALPIAAIFSGGALIAGGVFLAWLTAGFVDQSPSSVTDWQVLVYPLVLLFFVVLNTFIVNSKLSPLAVWTPCLLISGAMLFLLSKPGYVASLMATQVGIRLPGVTELRVPQATCRHVLAVTVVSADGAHAESHSCNEVANKVLAEVQFRAGNRWLLSVKEINGLPIAADAPRVTIPDGGTELVLPRPKPR